MYSMHSRSIQLRQALGLPKRMEDIISEYQQVLSNRDSVVSQGDASGRVLIDDEVIVPNTSHSW